MKKKHSLVLLWGSLAMGIGCIGAATAATSIAVASIADNTVEIAEVYAINSIIRFQADSQVEHEGRLIGVNEVYLTMPDGKIVSSKELKLNQYGAYSILIKGTGGETIVKTFSVKKDHYSTTMKESVIDYGSLNANFAAEGYNSGLKISLAEGDTFSIAQPINIYKQKVNRLVYWNLVELDPHVHYVKTRVTDAYDPDNYFEIVWRRGNIYYECWVGANVRGGSTIGFEENEAGSIAVGEEHYALGQFGGTWVHANNKDNGAFVNLDYQLDTTDPKAIKIYAQTDSVRKRYLIAELNNEKAFSEHFNGFTTGDVYVSMTASTFDGVTSAPIEIAGIGERRGEDLLPMDFYGDTKAPLILFDKDYDGAEIVSGLPIRLPTPIVKDDTAVRGDYEVSVIYGRGTAFERFFPLEGGCFVPKQYGTYSLVYSCEDTFGNRAEKIVNLHCALTRENGISFSTTPLTGVTGGENVYFDDFVAESINGEVDVEVSITSPSGIVTNLDNIHSPYWISEIGEFIVEYRYSDLLYTGSLSYTFKARNSGQAVFTEKEVRGLPSYFLEGYSYSVDAAPAYSFDEGKAKDAAIKGMVSYDGAEFIDVDFNNFTIQKGAKTMQFRFAIAENASIHIDSPLIPVVSTMDEENHIDLASYFQGEWNHDIDNECVRYSPKHNGSTNLDFVNRELFSSLRLDFSCPSALTSALTIRLADFYNPNNVLRLTLFADKTYSINGGDKRPLGAWMDRRISFNYNSDTGSFFVGEAAIDIVSPFAHDLVNMSLEFEDAVTGEQLEIYQVGNQPFNSGITRDRVAPMTKMEVLPLVGEIGMELTLERLYFADVLSPSPDSNSTMSAYLSTEDESIALVDHNGVKMENVSDFTKPHAVTLNDYGYYLVTYNCQDGKNNRVYGGISQGLSILDDIAPTIAFASYSGGVVSANAGEVTPLEVIVSDNVTAEANLDVWYFAYDEDERWWAATRRGGTLSLSSGNYTIYVSVTDEAGNSTCLSYPLQVK